MIDIYNRLKEMILELQESDIEGGIPRRISVVESPGKATIFMGVRRSGKSTFLFQRINRLLEGGVQRSNILYLNFFDDRLHPLLRGEIGTLLEAYYSLYPEKKNRETVHCFFDEIQVAPGWESFVDRLMRTENCTVTLTGSSARMLSREIATQMRGRSLSWEIFPFSFREFLDSRGIDSALPLSPRSRLLVQKGFDQYFEAGGFPEVAGAARPLRIKTHQEYFNALLFRDLIERHDISHPRALTDLAYRLIDSIASLYSVNALTGYLKSLGHKAPKPAVSDYLEWFEDAYFLFTVRLFDASWARSNANPKKIYCIDSSLAMSVGSGILVNTGHLLENLVFLSLRRLTRNIFYYRCKSGREVDFLVFGADRSRQLVQVCESLAAPLTRKRETIALSEAMAELGLNTGTLVTRNEEGPIEVPSGTISLVPAWRFLLELPEADLVELPPLPADENPSDLMRRKG